MIISFKCAIIVYTNVM